MTGQLMDHQLIRNAVKYEGGVSRRLFMAYGAALSSLPYAALQSTTQANERVAADPFTLGVASGDPDATSVLLWTRLAPAPLEPAGGMPNVAVQVRWELAEDDEFRKVVSSGNAVATPQLGHSVHVEVAGLKPSRWYWYRFHYADATSATGRTRTLPAPNDTPDKLDFAFASCQHYEQGLYTAYEQMARDELDLVFFLGDYIYEYQGQDGRVRKHHGNEIESLNDYRIRHSLYRLDPLLNAMHAKCPWFVTWDDHEFDNNYANDISEEPGIDPAEFLIRRANAYQAYYEMMPLRPQSLPKGPDMRLYRRAPFGRLAELIMLDTRQYRSDQPNGDGRSLLNDEALSSQQTMLGRTQKNWLCRSLISSKATWNVLAQQVMMAMVSRDATPSGYSMDQWPGYAHERMELMRFIAERNVPNPVVLTGDIHSNWVNSLRIDDRVADAAVVATEFVGTSISSGGNGTAVPRGLDSLLAYNPAVTYHNAERGYVRCSVTPQMWRSDYVVVDDVTKPGGAVSTRASFVVEAGRPGAVKA
jgi:alkaline phosphatase D